MQCQASKHPTGIIGSIPTTVQGCILGSSGQHRDDTELLSTSEGPSIGVAASTTIVGIQCEAVLPSIGIAIENRRTGTATRFAGQNFSRAATETGAEG